MPWWCQSEEEDVVLFFFWCLEESSCWCRQVHSGVLFQVFYLAHCFYICIFLSLGYWCFRSFARSSGGEVKVYWSYVNQWKSNWTPWEKIHQFSQFFKIRKFLPGPVRWNWIILFVRFFFFLPTCNPGHYEKKTLKILLGTLLADIFLL